MPRGSKGKSNGGVDFGGSGSSTTSTTSSTRTSRYGADPDDDPQMAEEMEMLQAGRKALRRGGRTNSFSSRGKASK